MRSRRFGCEKLKVGSSGLNKEPYALSRVKKRANVSEYREAYAEAALEETLEIETYLESRSLGLGVAFRAELNATVDALLEFPESAPVVSLKGIRRRVMPRFPYTVFIRFN